MVCSCLSMPKLSTIDDAPQYRLAAHRYSLRDRRSAPGLVRRRPSGIFEFEEMSHLFPLGAEIGDAGVEDVGQAGHAFDYVDAGLFDSLDLFRIVRHQADGFESEELEDGAGQFVVAEVAVEAELLG